MSKAIASEETLMYVFTTNIYSAQKALSDSPAGEEDIFLSN